MAKRRMIVVDIFSLIEQLTDLLSPSTDYVSQRDGAEAGVVVTGHPLRRQRTTVASLLLFARNKTPSFCFLQF